MVFFGADYTDYAVVANFWTMVSDVFVIYGHRLGTFFQKNAFLLIFFGKEIAIFVDKVIYVMFYCLILSLAEFTGWTEFWAEPHHLEVFGKVKGVGKRYGVDKLPKYDKDTDTNK